MNQKLNKLIKNKMLRIVQLHKDQKYEECISVASGALAMFFDQNKIRNNNISIGDKGLLAALKDVCNYYIQSSKLYK